MQSGKACAQRLGEPGLVLGVRIREEQADRDRRHRAITPRLEPC